VRPEFGGWTVRELFNGFCINSLYLSIEEDERTTKKRKKMSGKGEVWLVMPESGGASIVKIKEKILKSWPEPD
jgi:hypothetical protein